MNRFVSATAAAALLVGITATGTPTEADINTNGMNLQGSQLQGTTLQGVQIQGTSRAGAAAAVGGGAGFDLAAVKLSGVTLPDQDRAPRVKHEEAAE